MILTCMGPSVGSRESRKHRYQINGIYGLTTVDA